MTIHAKWLLMAMLVAVPGCQGCPTTELTFPKITDTSPGVASPEIQDVQNRFRARIENTSGWTNVTVFVRFARHFWPGPQRAHHGEATPVAGQAGVFEFILPPEMNESIRTGDAMFHQWFVEYQLPGGTDTADASTDVIRRVANCTDADNLAAMTVDQTGLLGLFDVDRPDEELPHDYRFQPHGWVCIRNSGVVFARHTTIVDATLDSEPALGSPQLLFYLPRDRRLDDPETEADEEETEEQYHQAITDTNPDPPYRLIGWAYGKPFNPDRRPRFTNACLASDFWFVHEAGYHLFPSGDMDLRPPGEEIPGSERADDLPPVIVIGLLGSGGYGMFHPRIWDLHLWRNDGGAPAISINPPANIEVPGLVLPPGSFFISQKFE